MQRQKTTPGIANINIKKGLLMVDESISRFEQEFLIHKNERVAVFRVFLGYSSSGIGGEIKAAFNNLLRCKLTRDTVQRRPI